MQLKKAGSIFTQRYGTKINYICKSSGGGLSKGLQGQAIIADYYLSANKVWMERTVAAGLIDPVTVKPLWGNKLLAATAMGSALEFQTWEELTAPKATTIIMGDPSATPFGSYFKEAMQAMGL